MAHDLQDAVFELCLALPQAEQFLSHGAPNFRVRGGKVFAIFVVNHHHDGRVALWLPAPAGAQAQWCDSDPEAYFVPPYVGPRGWLGVDLRAGLPWASVCARVFEAWQHIAPVRLRAQQSQPPEVRAPERDLPQTQVDPLTGATVVATVTTLRQHCLALPEVQEQLHYGTPSWYAGKRRFAGVEVEAGRAQLSLKVGVAQQALMIGDPRYHVPPFTGAQGWISCPLDADLDWSEIDALLRNAYEQVANQRMLRALR